ncbi:MAG: nucleotide sugar dehydrogenase [Candidatus Margulisiibacteriota bacterium]|jgi:UDP-N-acetyl-D-mannosaminuronic acid dehydrogenase
MKKVCVLGMGYMGLPTACLLAGAGYKVLGVDVNPEKIKQLKLESFKTTEPGLIELFKKALKTKNISFSTKIEKADFFVIAVPTPAINQKIDLKYVRSATNMIADVLENGNLVILESTVAPNVSRKILKKILDKKNKNYFLSHCPERAIPGNTLYELINNDRIIGGIDEKSAEMTKEIYSKFVKGKIYLTEITTAETVKLLENSFRDINIAFANEIAKLSGKIGIDPWEAIELANKHPRVNILNPGPGVGGHCISVDPWFLIQDDPESRFIRLARNINDSMPSYVVRLLLKNLEKETAKIAILGIAYKANVDDPRETPAEKVYNILKVIGYKVMATDPYVKKYEFKIHDINKTLRNADAVILVTDHDEYKNMDFKKYKLKCFIDTRHCINAKQLHKTTKLITFGNENRDIS